jgi:hypothetical protein
MPVEPDDERQNNWRWLRGFTSSECVTGKPDVILYVLINAVVSMGRCNTDSKPAQESSQWLRVVPEGGFGRKLLWLGFGSSIARQISSLVGSIVGFNSLDGVASNG